MEVNSEGIIISEYIRYASKPQLRAYKENLRFSVISFVFGALIYPLVFLSISFFPELVVHIILLFSSLLVFPSVFLGMLVLSRKPGRFPRAFSILGIIFSLFFYLLIF